MKKIVLFVFFIAIYSLAFCQNKDAEAKTYYITAEECFNRGTLEGYDDCITELENAQRSLGSTNPKILYLKIKAMGYSAVNYQDVYYKYDLIISFNTFFEITDPKNYPADKYLEMMTMRNKLHLKDFRYRQVKDSLLAAGWRQCDSSSYFRGKRYLGKQDAFAVECFLKAGQKGYGKAYAALGDYYQSTAMDLIRKGTSSGENDSVEMRWLKAASYYKKAVEAGFLYEISHSGDTSTCYLHEAGTLFYYCKQYNEALKYLGLASDLNWIEAFYLTGEIYYYGFAVPTDYKKALEYYMKSALSASNDRRRAMAKISDIYKGGLGVKRDNELAKEWARKSKE